ncbi:MAG TPA: hypothetical protein PKU78_05355, partial [Candidatus Dojkabacteria bacterium]|nr:hypothetical protein [Candidatus Dojkabacteria bacterium]
VGIGASVGATVGVDVVVGITVISGVTVWAFTPSRDIKKANTKRMEITLRFFILFRQFYKNMYS